MARIRSRHTTPEKLLRSALWRSGLRYRLHMRTPVGRPDIVFVRQKIAIFIDGCFWHGCPRHYVRPQTREDFWSNKLIENVTRDRRQTLELENQGWLVIRVWEHEVFENLQSIVSVVQKTLAEMRPYTWSDWRVVGVDLIDEFYRIERRRMERLRDPSATRFDEGPRITRKWKRP